MGDYSEAFVGIDTSKLRNAVAIADAGRGGEVRFLGEIENTPAATAKLVRKLSSKYKRLTFCYEAGPTGYGLHRQIKGLGFECVVVAPSLIPKRPGDKVKTNRRDALSLAKLLRADELTAVWVPDGRHEAMRDLTRARETAMLDLRTKRQHVSAFLLRLGRPYPESKKTWTKTHVSWIASQKLEHPQQRLVLEEMMLAIRQAQERLATAGAGHRRGRSGMVTCAAGHRIDGHARHGSDLGHDAAGRDRRSLAVPNADPVDGLSRARAFRDSTGDTVKRGPITKAGNRRARRMLVECSWSYQHPPRVGQAKQPKVDAAPPAVREIAWKAQCRLYRRYRTLIRNGKLKTVAIVAIARELAGFIWAVARAVTTARVAAAPA